MITPEVVMPVEPRIRIDLDIHPQDLRNDTLTLIFLIQISRDNGETWIDWGGFGFRGNSERQPNEQPFCDMPSEEEGNLGRVILEIPDTIRIGGTALWRFRGQGEISP